MKGFRVIPEGVTRQWLTRDVTLSSEPTSGQITETKYESPLKVLTLNAAFLSEADFARLPYAHDDLAFDAEWEFAESAWSQLLDEMNEALVRYNKSLISHAKELGLSSTSILGTSRTETLPKLTTQRPSTIISHNDRPVINTGDHNRLETIYEPSIRSIGSTRSRTSRKRSPFLEWMART